MQEQPELSIVTVNFNGLEDTRRFISSVLECRVSFSLEIIVVDNGSVRNEAIILQQEYPFIMAIRSEDNLGFAGGNNLGITKSTGKILYFLNNDTLLPQNAAAEMEAMLRYIRNNSSVGGISPKILYVEPPGMVQFAGSTPLSSITLRNRQIGYREKDNGQFDELKTIPYLHGAAMMVPRKVIDEVGYLPECYFLYYEEVDWSRMIRRKYSLVYFPKAQVYHKESATTGMDSAFKVFYLTRNRLIYACRNRAGWTCAASVFYQLFVASPFHFFKCLLSGKLDCTRAIIKGIFSFGRYLIAK